MRTLVILAILAAPIQAAVTIQSMKPSQPAPQQIGATITWKAKAKDTGAGPLTFQFSVAPPGGGFAVVKDFNVGPHKSGVWMSQPFVWPLTGIEGFYRVRVRVKDFVSGETDSKIVRFQVTPLATGNVPVVTATTHPLVALFSAPACPAGSNMRVSFQEASMATPATTTNWVPCHPPATMTFEIGGMYASTVYQMFSQTESGNSMVNGPPVMFTTGALPPNINFAPIKTLVPAGPNTDTTDSMVLLSIADPRLFHHHPPPDEAVDFSGRPMWYYGTKSSTNLLRRPLAGGTFLTTADGFSWTHASKQLLRQFDLEGNIIRETNIGIIQQQLLQLGYADGGPCEAIARPAPIGAACVGSFHHDDMQTLPGGLTAALVDIEKIYPPGTQGDTSDLPVDIVGDGIVVLDTNWQVVWFFDVFEHAGGAPQLDIDRPAVLGETCFIGYGGCPPMFLLGSGIAPLAHDWLHVNTIYYWPQSRDLLFSSRHQDWVLKVDYNDGAGTGNILWRLGPNGDFTFNNINNDPWPWNSHQHDVGVENGGAGPMTLFDNGNTRVSPPRASTGGVAGLGKAHCAPNDCHSRGMALMVDETNMTVTPVLSADLGVYSGGDGSAQMLGSGNYYFLAGIVRTGGHGVFSNSIQISPTAGAITGAVVLSLQAPQSYRGWQLANLYDPPTT